MTQGPDISFTIMEAGTDEEEEAAGGGGDGNHGEAASPRSTSTPTSSPPTPSSPHPGSPSRLDSSAAVAGGTSTDAAVAGAVAGSPRASPPASPGGGIRGAGIPQQQQQQLDTAPAPPSPSSLPPPLQLLQAPGEPISHEGQGPFAAAAAAISQGLFAAAGGGSGLPEAAIAYTYVPLMGGDAAGVEASGGSRGWGGEVHLGGVEASADSVNSNSRARQASITLTPLVVPPG